MGRTYEYLFLCHILILYGSMQSCHASNMYIRTTESTGDLSGFSPLRSTLVVTVNNLVRPVFLRYIAAEQVMGPGAPPTLFLRRHGCV